MFNKTKVLQVISVDFSLGLLLENLRKAGAILKANPLSAILTELIFPPPAYGSLTDEIKRGGYGVAPDNETGLYQLDPAVDRALRQQQSQMDAGISGTFVPVR